jgi:hypothetical protein
LMRDDLEAPQYGGELADITQGRKQFHWAPIIVAFKIIATSEPCWRSIRGFQGHCAEESNASRPRSAWQSATRLSRRPGESPGAFPALARIDGGHGYLSISGRDTGFRLQLVLGIYD